MSVYEKILEYAKRNGVELAPNDVLLVATEGEEPKIYEWKAPLPRPTKQDLDAIVVQPRVPEPSLKELIVAVKDLTQRVTALERAVKPAGDPVQPDPVADVPVE